MFSATLLTLAALVSSTYGAIYVTSPVSTTSWAAGSPQTISWQDDGTSPSLASFGNAMISIDVGNALEQTPVQVLVQSVNVATTSSLVFTPDASVGESGNFYFVRFQSLQLQDASQPQYPALAFSAKFSLTGMTGTFNASVQSEIDGQSTAPIGGSTPAGASSTSAPGATTSPTASKATTTPASGTKTSSSPSGTGTAKGNSSNGANGIATSGIAAFLSSFVAVVGAMVL